MALIKQSNLGSLDRHAIVLDLGDLQRQGAALLLDAQREADAIVADGRAERERLIEGAAAIGLERGMAEGREMGRKEGIEQAKSEALQTLSADLAKTTSAWNAALGVYLAEREGMMQAMQRDVLRLAVLIAERVVKRQIALSPGVVVDQLATVLATIVRPTELVVAVHPEDRGLIELAMPGLARRFSAMRVAEVVDDASLARGSCVARMRGRGDGGGESLAGGVDASIQTQLDRIVETLLPGEGRSGDVGGPGEARGG
jgi:flagellar assembly protein FliH